MLKRSSKSKGGQYPTAFKLKAIKRVERGEGVLPVALDLGGHVISETERQRGRYPRK